jgi:hypothetical protein
MPRDVSPWAVRGLYVLGLIITIAPLLELVQATWPFRPAELLWRYGALGLAAGYMPNVTLGLAILMAMTYVQEYPRLLWALGLSSLVLAALILAAMTMFALDFGTVGELRAEELRGATRVAGVLQEIKYLGGGVALAFLGLGALWMGRPSGARAAEREDRSPGALRSGYK